jgi:hypothetical protein
MRLKRGDHVCAMYSKPAELADVVARFLTDGLGHHEQCWYVASGDETDEVRAALEGLNVDVNAETARKALRLISARGAYIVHGEFEPEATMRIFNDAIEQAYADGFTGFRAAAEMSWALDREDGAHQLIVYEALLRSLFANCRAIGLCLYNRERMPLAVINGALSTHPVAGTHGTYRANPFYDSTTHCLSAVNEDDVLVKLQQLDRSNNFSLNRR